MSVFRHLKAWIRRGRLDDELREELAQHVAWKTDSLIADGVPEGEARRRAAVDVGNVTRLREQSRAIWGFPSLDSVMQDARYGLRQLRRTPLFTVATVATLGLTIGATSALFAIANAVILRPLPYPQSDRIVSLSTAHKGTDTRRMDEPTALLAADSPLASFETLAMYNSTGANLTGGAQPERVSGVRVSERFFDVMRTQPGLGRTFTSEERQANGPPAIVLSDSLWARAFARSPDVLQREVRLDDKSYTVIGVMPSGFRFPGRCDFWLPFTPREIGKGGFFYADFIARLSQRGSPASAREDLLALRKSRASDLPTSMRDADVRVMTVHERLYGDFRAPIALLFGAVVCVLFIGCANVANLLLARTAVRRQELAIRTALGAGRGRLARQMLVESILLALLGCIPGLVLLTYALQVFAVLGPAELRKIPGIGVDVEALMFMLGVTLAVGLLFGMAPAIAARRSDPHEALKGAGGRGGHGVRSRPRRALVTLEIAAAVVVMIGASLLAKSLVRFHAVDRGFHADNVLTASITLPRPRYAEAAARRAFFDAVLKRVRALPAVESAAAPAGLGMLSMTMTWPTSAEASAGKPPGAKPGVPSSESQEIGVRNVGLAYFRTFDIPIRNGRECDGSPEPSAVLNERMARFAFPGRSPIGQRLTLSGEGTFTVVGVAADVRPLRTNAAPMPMVLTCPVPGSVSSYGLIALRARGDTDAASLAPALRAAVAAVDPAQPIAEVATVRQQVDDSLASRRFDTLLFGGFAALAFTLSVFGLYAVTAYLVAQRSHEFGVRIALGAGRATVLRLVLRQGLPPAVAGIVLGLLAAVLLTRLLRTMLFEVEVLDAWVFAGVALVLGLVSIAAAIIPARRAIRVDPVVALRCD
jgi:putative ABC transport system permease protein